MQDLTNAFVELIRRTSTDLPGDMELALRDAREYRSARIGRAGRAGHDAGQPGDVAAAVAAHLPGHRHADLRGALPDRLVDPRPGCADQTSGRHRHREVVSTANAVDSISGANSGDNTGTEFPTIHFHEWDEDAVQVELMLKGGGCENVGAQYSLPNAPLKAGRDLEGVRKVVLDAVQRAQGQGCAPGVLGVAIGGDRGASYAFSKQQLFRPLGDRNDDPELASLEETIKEQANELGIGPMGFGGNTTVLDVQIDSMHRLPASFFVSVSYMCWANRRRSMTVRGEDVAYQ